MRWKCMVACLVVTMFPFQTILEAASSGPAPGSAFASDVGRIYKGEYYSDKPTRETANRIRVNYGQTVPDIDFLMEPGSGGIDGRVISEETGLPLENITVFVYAQLGWDWMYFSVSAVTGPSGYYRIEGLPGFDDYQVSAIPPDDVNLVSLSFLDSIDPNAYTPVSVREGQITHNIDFKLPKGGIIRGNVLRADTGAPVASSWVLSVENDLGNGKTATVQADGSYEIVGLTPGNYILYVWPSDESLINYYYNHKLSYSSADRVHVIAGDTPPESQTHIDFLLPKGGVISGVVRQQETGLTCKNMSVGAQENANYYSRGAQTDENGGYRIEGLVTGSYSVYCYALDIRYENVSVTAPNETRDIDFEMCRMLSGYGDISGTVLDADTHEGLMDLIVTASSSGGYYEKKVCTDSDGSYLICDLSPGLYRVRVTAPETRWVAEYYDDKIEFADAEVVQVEPDAVTRNIDFELKKGGVIQGKVYSADRREPLKNYPVSIDYGSDTPYQRSTVFTDDNGEYIFEYLDSGGLPPADYFVRAHYYSQWTACNEGTPTPTATPTFTPTPTPTPDGSGITVDLTLSQPVFHPGDLFLLTALIANSSGVTYSDIPLVVLLYAYGYFYWYPLWTTDFAYVPVTLTADPMTMEILRFTWPEISSSGSGLIFYAAILNYELTGILGVWDMAEFGWEP